MTRVPEVDPRRREVSQRERRVIEKLVVARSRDGVETAKGGEGEIVDSIQ